MIPILELYSNLNIFFLIHCRKNLKWVFAALMTTMILIFCSQLPKMKMSYMCYEKFNYNQNTENSFLNTESEHSCQPKTHIFLLKTHKTASSTIMNILFRFGDSRNLTYALPIYSNDFIYPAYFSQKYVKGFSKESNQTFHMLCHHMRFQLSEVQEVMPNDTFYFTILRNPISLMESSFQYYKSSKIFKTSKSLEDFLYNSSKYYKEDFDGSQYAKNLMTFDMGFSNNGGESAKHIKLLNQAVETMFDLVLISEYFDESLVILKDKLCWTLDDVLSIPLNIRSNDTKEPLTLEIQDKIKNWNQLDWQLYNHFNETFWNHVKRFGSKRMEREVEELRKRRKEMSQVCFQGDVDPEEVHDDSLLPYQSGIAKIRGYNLKTGLKEAEEHLCRKLITPELQYTERLWIKQYKTSPHYKQLAKKKKSVTEKAGPIP
uniref:Galactose-3-O-sulfotransferase 2 n=1 Tax=Leptobrachium leishanense TaxID=445787 RepID=A0A8C5PE70_9ANUR